MPRKTFLQILQRGGNMLLRPLGLAIGGRNPAPGEIVPRAALTQDEAVDHLRWLRDKLGFAPSCMVDLGASDGRWARPAKRVFPECKMLLVEPQQCHNAALMDLERCWAGIHVEICAVGEYEGVVELFTHGHQTSMLGDSEGRPFGETTLVPIRTLDSLVQAHGLPWPDLIKMDIQGAELTALKGATECLKHAEFVQSEFTLLPVQKDIPLLDELVVYLADQGFRIFNVYGVCGRPLDGAPAQGEVLFIKKQSRLITDMRWSQTSNWS